MGFFTFKKRPFPDPGTGNMAYVQLTGFPQFDAGGAGRRVYSNLNIQSHNIIMTNTVNVQGLGGLFSGQIVGQALMEPDRGI